MKTPAGVAKPLQSLAHEPAAAYAGRVLVCRAPFGLDLRKTGFRGSPCYLGDKQHAQRAALVAPDGLDLRKTGFGGSPCYLGNKQHAQRAGSGDSSAGPVPLAAANKKSEKKHAKTREMLDKKTRLRYTLKLDGAMRRTTIFFAERTGGTVTSKSKEYKNDKRKSRKMYGDV
jgi:hypothetical protein